MKLTFLKIDCFCKYSSIGYIPFLDHYLLLEYEIPIVIFDAKNNFTIFKAKISGKQLHMENLF